MCWEWMGRGEVRGSLILFRVLVDHVTIFNSSSMQHLRWSKWLETVVGSCYIEICHKYESVPRSDSEMHRSVQFRSVQAIKYSICYLNLQSQQKHTRPMCQIYSKLVIDTPERHLVLLLLTLNIFCPFFFC